MAGQVNGRMAGGAARSSAAALEPRPSARAGGAAPPVGSGRSPYTSTGLETVIGRTARTLEASSARPGLDVREGTARKLQFAGPPASSTPISTRPRAAASRSSPISTPGSPTAATWTAPAASPR